MTLATRLTAFSLAGLGLALAGFSFLLHGAVGRHLHGRLDERLHNALNVLTAATEENEAGIEWEPGERRLAVGDGIAWLVTDPTGNVVDRGGPDVDFLEELARQLFAEQRAKARHEWRDERWQVRHAWIMPEGAIQPHTAKDKERAYPALNLTVATSVAPIHSELRELALLLIGMCVGLWTMTLFVSRAFGRSVLRPLTQMADDARDMDGSDLRRRLNVSAAGDELTTLGEDFNGLLDRVQESFERQRRFTGEASHQLRTPLAALLGQTEVALRRERSPEEYRQTLSSVHQQADRLRKIVDALLFLARADTEARLPDREILDLGPWLSEHIRQAWSGHARARDFRIEAESNRASVHAVLLGELVNVLLDNACKYSPPGTPIAIRVAPVGNAVELSISNSGAVIDEADLERIFEPFVRAETARRDGVEGLGLGLAVARRIATAHGGTLTVTSSADQGVRFTFRLPLAQSAE